MTHNSKSAIGLIKEHVACPQCQRAYAPGSRFRSLTDSNDGYYIHGQCRNCGGCVLLSGQVKDDDLMITGTVTELTYSDVQKFAGLKALSADDVLLWHRFWLELDGDFSKALSAGLLAKLEN